MPFSSDTSPEARRVVIEALRRMTPPERLAKAMEMTASLRSLARAGVQRDLPAATESERHEEFLRRWLGVPLGEVVIAERRRRSLAQLEAADDRG
ncbi:MAG: hypothetical protein ABIS67_01155 [Candidatus Eisenbacteria bacterium]